MNRDGDDLDRGDVGRIVMAHKTCIELLAGDLRIQRFYAELRAGTKRALPRLLARCQTTADVDRLHAIMGEQEVETTAGVLRGIGVPWRWCAEALVLVIFPHWTTHPGQPATGNVFADLWPGMPKGRMPRHGGADVAEWVRWWYRRTIKQPPDALHELVEEYATRANRVTEAHSVVQNGIERAEILLNRVIDPKTTSADPSK